MRRRLQVLEANAVIESCMAFRCGSGSSGWTSAATADWSAPHRTDRHDTTAAQREVQLIHLHGQAQGELDSERIDAPDRDRLVGEDEAVVLVGKQKASLRSARPHDDHRDRIGGAPQRSACMASTFNCMTRRR